MPDLYLQNKSAALKIEHFKSTQRVAYEFNKKLI